MRCRWCCNPESQSSKIETMLQNGKPKTIGYDITAGEVMETVMQDMPYYRRSGGGLTLSGGETLCQPAFAGALCTLAHRSGINTAIETTLCADYETAVAPLIPLIDTFLCDLKHMDSEKHRAYTLQPNEKILANFKRLAQEHKRLIVRVPVIPGFNDTPEDIRNIAVFAHDTLRIGEMHILPYHRLGYDKYIGLGRDYPMGDVPSPAKEHMTLLQKVCEAEGLICHIGG